MFKFPNSKGADEMRECFKPYKGNVQMFSLDYWQEGREAFQTL